MSPRPQSAASSGKGSGKGARTRFKPGNPHAWPPGKSGNPKGGALVRPLYQAMARFYGEKPQRLAELVEVLHNAAAGRGKCSSAQIAAFSALAKRIDREHLREDGTDRPVLDDLTVVFEEGRGPERAPITLTKNAPETKGLEFEFDGQPPP